MLQAKESGRRQKPLCILLAEDEVDILLVAKLALEEAGILVDTAGNGLEVLDKVRRKQYDVILMDVMMPRMDGYLACERLRLDVTTRDIPVIFLTAKAQRDEIERGKKLGALGYITKPFDAYTLAEQVSRILAGKGAVREASSLN